MYINKNLFRIGLVAFLFTMASCEQDNRQDEIESLREDHREWEQDYRERDQEIQEKRRELSQKMGATATQGTAGQQAQRGTVDVQTRPGEDGTAGEGSRARGLGGSERVDDQVVADPAMRQGIMDRLQEVDQKHQAMREEHRALLEKHLAFINRNDLPNISEEEWDNHRDLIRSDHDRMENDQERMRNELEEIRSEAENITDDRENVDTRNQNQGARDTEIRPQTRSPQERN